ncbi:SAP domain-containing protein [Metabacillus sp. KIGAM252]|uniref:SAP domain-containing protein n=1 Tax=Metabacillus flavus TaxID=2823519 RepID=A0ABS5LFI4_9BACI|nr:DUF6434 domain-containing protein [Metabacillus flavus]MBS2969511.1 SAP domain-containing protein [Metabacillus flavus]
MKPNLTLDTPVQEFKDYYWLKEELQSFCRKHGLSPSGSKSELSSRIELFLQTGEILKPLRSPRKRESHSQLSLETVITENHRCSQEARVFFKTVIGPKFHFSTYIQNYFKTHAGYTYRDAVYAWHEEEERKKESSYKTAIAPQFEYNQFTRDFFADPANKGKTRKEAIDAWNTVKNLPGSNRYKNGL